MLLLTFILLSVWVVYGSYSLFAHRPRSLKGSTIVITGACSEVGQRLCHLLHGRGARIIALDYSRVKLNGLQEAVLRAAENEGPGIRTDRRTGINEDEEEQVSKDGSRGAALRGTSGAAPAAASGSASTAAASFLVVAVDPSSRLQVQRVAKEIQEPVDILINAAHVTPGKPLHDSADDAAERMQQAQLLTPVTLLRQLLPRLMIRTAAKSSSGSAMLLPWQRRRGDEDYAQVVFITMADANFCVSDASPDYAATQWATAGWCYSLPAWLARVRAALASPERHVDCTLFTSAERETALARGPKGLREVRVTLLSIDKVSEATSYPVGAVYSIATGSLAGSPTTTGPRQESAGRDEDGRGGDWSAHSSQPPYRTAAQKAAQRRRAELDGIALKCVDAISRGESRRLITAGGWTSSAVAAVKHTLLYPLCLMLPFSWASRVLRLLQLQGPASLSSAATIDKSN